MEKINSVIRHKNGEYMQAIKCWKSSKNGKKYYTGYLPMTTKTISWSAECCQVIE